MRLRAVRPRKESGDKSSEIRESGVAESIRTESKGKMPGTGSTHSYPEE